ncbi:hypothetical protein BX666DRAFT_1935290 [Dichotomocladium elegans]|nr:hypothetical protein BX666DRAFT_1935290 [Dichotomocladium elegans]
MYLNRIQRIHAPPRRTHIFNYSFSLAGFMGNSFSTNELKACISRDLKINVAFPFFPAGRDEGSAACCVVDSDWIERLTNSDSDEITLKSPGSHTTASSSSCSPSGNNQHQKQSPTMNIYVNVLAKDPTLRNNFELYHRAAIAPRESNTYATRNGNKTFILDHESQKDGGALQGLTDSFGTFESIFDASVPDADRQEVFLKRIRMMLWPQSKRYKIVDNDGPNHLTLRKQIDKDTADDHADSKADIHPPQTDLANSNLPEVFSIIESDTAYFFLAHYRGTTLQDLITYNPGVLSSNLKKCFVVYQILRSLASLHSRGILHGSIKSSNILVDENLWIQLAGMEYGVDPRDIDIELCMKEYKTSSLYKEINEEPLVMKWVKGEISNFSYLMALNHLAGRREGDPNFHPIMPWITDFSGSKIEDGWRDFTKTKFRMNKGEEQLDFTFNGPVPHHITDILSDITYYVYLARRTPIPVLCQFVRSKYEPNEYPSSMQRLYSWTPDECIPEFYTDPTIFTSIHSDMPDLQIPEWAASPEDFIRKHAEALESDYVSENLHHWIDLTFGNNLTGKGAVEAKNVALPLLAGQNSFMKHGIIQLFRDKHPQRGCNWNKSKISSGTSMSRRTSNEDTQLSAAEQQPIIPDRQSSYSTPSIPSQRSFKGRQSSAPPSHLHMAESPSGNSVSIRERAASVRSSCSSVDTSTSLTSRSTNAAEQVPPGTTGNAAGLTSILRNEPIRLPNNIPEDYFVENLTHYEETMEFSARYKFMQSLANLPVNPIYPRPSKQFDINPFDAPAFPTNKFSIGAAYDMYCAGKIIESIFMAGNGKVMDAEGEPSHTASGYFEMGNGDVSYDIAPTGRVNILPTVTSVISALTDDNWQRRPSAKYILSASFPTLSFRDPTCSFPFPECIPDMYEYLASFYQAEWSRRLYLADKWIDRICDLENEAFMLILSTFTSLFAHDVTRVGSISLFPRLAHRLGPEKARQYLLKPILFMFETLRPNLPKALFDQKIIDEFVKRLGTATFLQQMLPCYLESMALNCGDVKITAEKDDALNKGTLVVDGSGTTAASTVAELAGEAMAHICKVLGPILTSKHIVRQLVKIAFRDNAPKPVLMTTMKQIAKTFGETFTSIQYAYLISLIDQHLQRQTNERNTRIICSVLSLLEELLHYMSGQLLATELKSGFVSTLYKLLEPIPPSEEESKSISEQSIRLRLTLSMRTIDHLVRITRHLPIKDWEATITPMLQKYFSGFTSNITGDGQSATNELEDSWRAQRNYQMMYAYYQFCNTVSKATIQRIIPTSDAIEKLMYDQFAAEPETSEQKEIFEARNDEKAEVAVKTMLIDYEKLYESSVRGLYPFAHVCLATGNDKGIELEKLAMPPQEAPRKASGSSSAKSGDKENSNSPKSKVPTSVLPWRTKWKPSPEDRKNWNRFLSTNSEEMSKSMQFSFNDLKLRGFAGHTAAVRTISVNEPVKLFASGSKDRTVKIWSLNVHDGIEHWETSPYSDCLVTYAGHRRGTISDVHFLPGIGSGLTDIMASCDGHVHLWSPETGKEIHQFNTGRPSVVTLKPIFHYRNLVGGTAEGSLTFYDTHNFKTLHTWKSSANLTGNIRIIAVNHSETLIAIGFSTGAISLLESRTGTLVASWKGGDTEITMMKFYTDELLVSCAPADHLICCWNVTRLALMKTISAVQDVVALDLFKDEILTINSSNSVSFIPINDELQSYSSKFKSSIIKSQVSAFAIVPTEPSLLFGSAEGEIFLYA